MKRAKDTLDIRNKRILQLESQIGHAASNLSDNSDTSNDVRNPPTAILKRIEIIEYQLNRLTAVPANNIVINTYKTDTSDHTNIKQTTTTPTQTNQSTDASNNNSTTGELHADTLSDSRAGELHDEGMSDTGEGQAPGTSL